MWQDLHCDTDCLQFPHKTPLMRSVNLYLSPACARCLHLLTPSHTAASRKRPWPTWIKYLAPGGHRTNNKLGQKVRSHTHWGFLEARWPIWFELKKNYSPHISSYIWVAAVYPALRRIKASCRALSSQVQHDHWTITHPAVDCDPQEDFLP